MIALPAVLNPRCSALPRRRERAGLRLAGALLVVSLAFTAMAVWWFAEQLLDPWVTLDGAGWATLAAPFAILGALCILALHAVRRGRGCAAIALVVTASVVAWFLTFFLAILTDPLGL